MGCFAKKGVNQKILIRVWREFWETWNKCLKPTNFDAEQFDEHVIDSQNKITSVVKRRIMREFDQQRQILPGKGFFRRQSVFFFGTRILAEPDRLWRLLRRRKNKSWEICSRNWSHRRAFRVEWSILEKNGRIWIIKNNFFWLGRKFGRTGVSITWMFVKCSCRLKKKSRDIYQWSCVVRLLVL